MNRINLYVGCMYSGKTSELIKECRKSQLIKKKVLTINKFHHNVLEYHGLKIPIGIFYNYVDKEIYEQRRTIFKKRLCFIGRFSDS